MQLRAGLRVLRSGTREVQIGTDPRWAVRVRGLSAKQCEVLLRAGDRPLAGLLPEQVLDRLREVGLLRRRPRRSTPVPPAMVPDAWAYALAGDGDPGPLLRRRARAVVGITGLGRCGAQVAVTLAAAGIGTVLLDDDGPVRPSDVGTLLEPQEVGVPRSQAVTRLLGRLSPATRTSRTGSRPPQTVVSVSAGATDPALAIDLLAADVPHLPVVVREGDALVGPFVVPDEPPCLRCVDLHRVAADPAWPRVLVELTGPRATSGGVPAALATVAAGLAAADVLRLVDGERPHLCGRQYEVPVPSLEPRSRAWAAHPDCGCAALPTIDMPS